MKLIRAIAIAAAAVALTGLIDPGAASARPKTCFGKRINRVISGSNRTVHLEWGDTAWIAGDRVTVKGASNSYICADRGRQYIHTAKGTSKVATGDGDDIVVLYPVSTRNVVKAGLGNDRVIGARGNDVIYASPRKNPRNLPDRDLVSANGGNNRIHDYSGQGNQLKGGPGHDDIYSLGRAVSVIHAGGGNDRIFSTGGRTKSGRIEQLFGERGNDLLNASRRPNNGSAYLDGGLGDDKVIGSNSPDTVIFQSGVNTINTKRGDDLVVMSSKGKAKLDGGPGNDTVSFAMHTPPGYRHWNGVHVDLGKSGMQNVARRFFSFRSFENVSGSPFDDFLFGRPGVKNVLRGGLGNDVLAGNGGGSVADGGLGNNQCDGFSQMHYCNNDSPGRPDGSKPVVDIDESGILTVLGSNGSDQVRVGYDILTATYRVKLDRPAIASGLCDAFSSGGELVNCPADMEMLNGIAINGNVGNDRLTIESSVPATVTSALNGGSGRNILTGGRTKDFIMTGEGNSAGSVLMGGSNSDMLYVNDRVTIKAGPGNDAVKATRVCVGARISGGKGKDNLVFVGARHGVNANLQRGTAFWNAKARCDHRLKMARDFEGLEGTRFSDRLTLGRKLKTQGRDRSLLGREGHDTLNSRNGYRDTVSTGSGDCRTNRVIADRSDKVICGWGSSAAR